MNNENKLFNDTFIKKISSSDIDKNKKEEFIKKYNESKEKNSNFEKNEKVDNTEIIHRTSILSIDSRIRDLTKYPFANYFECPFGRVYKNVSKIELISSEIPNSDQVIRDLPLELKNNTMYWKNKEDFQINYIINCSFSQNILGKIYITVVGHSLIERTYITLYNSKLDTQTVVSGIIDDTYICDIIDENTLEISYKSQTIIGSGTTNVDLGQPFYTVEFKPGNYNSSTLTTQMASSFNQIKRLNGNGQYHFFEVGVNTDTDVITCDSVITTQLSADPITTTASSEIITVYMFSHGLKNGDRVKMIDVKTTGGIQGSVLSGDFNVNIIDFNTFTYEVNIRAIETISGGGNTVKVGKDAPFRFLLDTKNTKIQYNTGFPNEDSSESINKIDPFTTYTIGVRDVQISGNYILITTTTDHNLQNANIFSISNISTGYPCEVTTTMPHMIHGTQIIRIRDTNSVPSADGEYTAVYTGPYTFTIDFQVQIVGNTGQVLYGGDKIIIENLKTTPRIINPYFFVENGNLANDQFSIRMSVINIDMDTISESVIRTSHLYVNHPNHGFNNIDSIYQIDSNFTYIHSPTFQKYSGIYKTLVNVINGPASSNTLDIILNDHGFTTSDEIRIINSTTVPNIDGSYKIQYIDPNTIRINYVHSSFTGGTCNIFSGDKINISESNSLPKIDGYWYVINKYSILNIPITNNTNSNITITLDSAVSWNAGDFIDIKNTNCQPSIDGSYQIISVNLNQITIFIQEQIINPGTTGKVINKNSMLIYTNLQISNPGNYAILGRSQQILHYRAESEDDNGFIGGIKISEINSVSRKIARIIDQDNYMIRIDNSYATSTVTGGGKNVTVSSDLHGYRSIQANTFTGDKFGKLYRSISLEGENYIYLVIPGLETVSTTSTNLTDVFAKIILNQSPGIICFNSFISAPKIFDPPKEKFDSLKLKMIDYQGYSFNFNDLNYSLSFKITERVEYIKNTNLLSNASIKLVKDKQYINYV